MLLLFDIDLTLIETAGAGADCLVTAGRHVFANPTFHDRGVAYAGRLDSLIIADMLHANHIEPTQANIRLLGDAYVAAMEAKLQTHDARRKCRVLPGVHTLLAALAQEQWPTLGLLTGNYERSGRAKLLACGLDADAFAVRVWAGCAPRQPARREDLPEVGLARASLLLGRTITGRESVIIGDTVHDVRAARAHDCWCLGVLTGSATGPELLEAGADGVVANLADTQRVMKTLTQWRTSQRSRMVQS